MHNTQYFISLLSFSFHLSSLIRLRGRGRGSDPRSPAENNRGSGSGSSAPPSFDSSVTFSRSR